MNILASAIWSGIIDLVILFYIIVLTLIGLKVGFARRFVAVMGGLFAFVLALLLCKPFSNLLNSLFQTNSWFANISQGWFKGENFNKPLTSIEQLQKLLDSLSLPNFIKNAVEKIGYKQGDTLAMLLGRVIGNFFSIGISFIIIFICAKLLSLLLKLIFKSMENKSPSFSIFNKILGVIFGFFQGLLTVSMILFIISILPFGTWFRTEIANGWLATLISNKNFFGWIFSLFLYK